MLLGPSDCPRLRFNVLSIDYVRVTNCFYDYDYDYYEGVPFASLESLQFTTKSNEVIAEKPFPNSGVTRRLWMLGRLN